MILEGVREKMNLYHLKEKVLELDINKIIGSYIKLERSGRNYKGLCPFHDDKRIGSFIVSNDINKFKCFSCEAKGDGIHFVSEYLGISYYDALRKIAAEENITLHDGKEKYFSNNYNLSKGQKINNVNNSRNNKDLNFSNKTAYREKLDYIYRLFLGQLFISKEHVDYLTEVRNISRHTIEKRLYKSYPKSEVMDKFIEALKSLNDGFDGLSNEEIVDELLSDVPGFYKERVGDRWTWKIPKFEGIIIPIKDADGFVVGLQIRKDSDSDRRYIWFSSNFANNDGNKMFGTSPGSPVDVIYPDNQISKVIYITEGRFKSEMISQNWNSIAISVQGVGNWKGIDEEIRKLICRFGNDFFQKIYIAYDSDLAYKEQVYNQAKNMSDLIGISFPDIEIDYLTWDVGKCKGIDDLLSYCRSNNIDVNDAIKSVTKGQFDYDRASKEYPI